MKRRLTAILLALCMELSCMMPATVVAAETEAIETENIGAESESTTEGKAEEAVQTETATESEETAGEKVEEVVQMETAIESEETTEGKVEDVARLESGIEEENTTDTENTIVDEEVKESETTSLKEQSKASRSPAKEISNHRASVIVKICTATYKDGVNGTVFPDYTREFTVIINPVTNQVISSTSRPGSEFKGTPTRTGYYFTGWDPAEVGPITENIIYTAQWSAKMYHVVLHENGGSSSESTDQIQFFYDEERNLILPGYFAKSGYVFAGWNTESDGSGTSYAGGAIVKNLTDSGYFHLYAQWKEDRNGNGIADDEEQCTVRYITNPDDPADSSNQTTGNLLAGDPTPAYKNGSTPTRTGYTFEGWEPAVAETVTEDAEYNAKWSPVKYGVTMLYNMGESGDIAVSQIFTYDQEQALSKFDGGNKPGYVFAGWNTERDGSGKSYGDGEKVKNLMMYSGTLHLYAQWKEDRNGNGIADDEEKRYIVRYINPDDPSGSSDQITGNLLAGDKTPAFEGDTPSRTGYEFAGWEPDVADTVTGDATYTVKWTAKSYKVTLVLNGGMLADEKNVTSYTYAEGAVLPAADNVTFLCHTFDGWYADSSFSGSPEAEISKSSTGDRVLYAKWTESHTLGKAVKENEKAKTCEANGSYDNVIYCAVCSAELSRNTVTVPATGHSYGAVTYTWSTDNQKCTAERKCTACDETESETADTTATVVQEKNCTLPELTTYNVTFENSAFESQIKENVQTAEATGHNLEKVEKKDATTEKEGNSTYWFCNECNKYFSDEKAENEIKKEDTVLAKLSAVSKKETEGSSEKTTNATKTTSTTDKTTNASPKTGDSTNVQLYVILMLVSIGAAAGVGARRKLKTRR